VCPILPHEPLVNVGLSVCTLNTKLISDCHYHGWSSVEP
jgi:hypothetical protein